LRLIDALSQEKFILEGNVSLMDVVINGITCDSRKVKSGFLFAAISGKKFTDDAFISDAISKGASAILIEEGTKTLVREEAIFIKSKNARRAYAIAASRFYGPNLATVAAITGTNGKTSTVSFLRQIWASLGYNSCSLGTLGIEISDVLAKKNISLSHVDLGLTTPDSVDIHRSLKGLTKHELKYIAVEASSHGLHQFRLDGLKISAAAFTNLTRDHFDYHQNFENYSAAKMRLFQDLLMDDGVAVFNFDDPFSAKLSAMTTRRKIRSLSYGYKGNDIKLLSSVPSPKGQNVDVDVFGQRLKLKVPLIGHFQTENALCAATVAIGLGANIQETCMNLENLIAVPGRVQFVGFHKSGASIFVDYAHTPSALTSLLKALRPHTKRKLGIVFGCGGDRDSGKRAEMGNIAHLLADRIIITDDNPRDEKPEDIRSQILAACPVGKEIGCRELAILSAISCLEMGDSLVVAGKGHETNQIIGDQIMAFDDVEVIESLIGSNRN